MTQSITPGAASPGEAEKPGVTSWLECATCGQQFPITHPSPTRGTGNRPLTQCELCGNDWLDARYDYQAVASTWRRTLAQRPFTSIWRYRELLPVRRDENIISMGEGGTPLLHCKNLGLMLGCPNIYMKDERQGPTGSFKDRQASLAISVMKELDVSEAVLASTGNVAISYAAYGARAGIKIWAFVTSTVPADKMREVALYGAEVIKVTATYDQTKQVAARFAAHKQLHLDQGIRSIAAKESMKTVAFEIAEQLPTPQAAQAPPAYEERFYGQPEGAPPVWQAVPGSEWRAPDWYFQAVSGGLGPVGVWKGFDELKRMGLTDRMPRLACVQAAGCAPMVHSFRQGLDQAQAVLNPQTLITTVATGSPGIAYTFLQRVIRKHGGAFESVSDEEAFRAMHTVAKLDGISMEPAAAIAFAGLFKMVHQGVVKPDEVIVVNCSGHTFPVEKHLLDEGWVRSLDLDVGLKKPARPVQETFPLTQEEGLLASLERLDDRVKSVAIIEDEADAARLLRRIIQSRGGYQIFEAHDGREGLELIRREQPDLVLLDLMMPEIDGFTLLGKMKEEEETADIPVIVITAKELTTQERRRLSGHVESLLQKGSYVDMEMLDDLMDVLA
jgi:threonine synthase